MASSVWKLESDGVFPTNCFPARAIARNLNEGKLHGYDETLKICLLRYYVAYSVAGLQEFCIFVHYSLRLIERDTRRISIFCLHVSFADLSYL